MSERFTNVCPPVPSHWANKKTATVYDLAQGVKIAQIPAFPYRTRKQAISLAERLCRTLNAAEACRFHFTREQLAEAFLNEPYGPDINDPVFNQPPYNYPKSESEKGGAE